LLLRCAPPKRSTPIGRAHLVPLFALDRPPHPHTPYGHQPNAPVQKRGTIMDIAEFELGLGLFEALTVIHGKVDSAVQPSLDAALVWLRGRLLDSVMHTKVAVPDCTAAVYDGGEESVALLWDGTTDYLAALMDHLAL